MPDAPPGWYDDPYGGDIQRYWDGHAWALDGGPDTERPDAQTGAADHTGAGGTTSDGPIQISLEDLDPDPVPAATPLVAGPSLTVTLGPDTDETPAVSSSGGIATPGDTATVVGATTSVPGAATPPTAAAAGAPPATATLTAPPIPPPSAEASSTPDDGTTRRRPWLVALVVALAVAVLGVGIVAAMALGGDDEPAPTTTTRPDRGGGSPPTSAASPPATSAPATSPPATQPPATQAPSSGFEIGDPFSEQCVVAWPSAPIRDAASIQMQMSCPGVPSEFFLVQVVYPDPELEVTPSTGAMQVTGDVADIAQSQLGYQVLVVVADDIQF